MTATITTLARRISRLERLASPGVKHWHIGLITGRAIPPDVQAQIGEHDVVVIRFYSAGYLGDERESHPYLYAWHEEQFVTHKNAPIHGGNRRIN